MAKRKRYTIQRWFKILISTEVLADDLHDAVNQAQEMKTPYDFGVEEYILDDHEMVSEPSILSP